MPEKRTILNPAKALKAASNSFPIVGIGASAGGLEALEQFFANMPDKSGMAFIVIQHLDPNHVGIMPELLQRTTPMTVTQVTDNLRVEPNHVYVIPPNKSMSILNGSLHLSEPVESRGLRLPIDTFFRSLADDQQEKSIGIILSGMGSDGSLGVKAIKEKNGIVMVQDPQTSKFDGMPGSALSAVSVDIMAPATALPSKLIALLRYSPAIEDNLIGDDKNKNNLEKITILLRTQTGHDFSLYKKTTLYRRIERRMNIHKLNKISGYVRFLQENPNELNILFKEFLIGVTNFFRDSKVWEKLKDQVLPELFNKLPDGHVLRVWITGCSTGEEAYSFAIVYLEAYEKVKQSKNFTLQVFATDIDSDAIDLARKGVYNSNIVNDVSPQRLKQFFTQNETTYSINSSIREMVVFAPHDVIKDPPFTKMDILLCRNLLIYMESDLQKKLMNLFFYSLRPGGVLLVGTSETVNLQDMLFTAVDTKLKIYKRTMSHVEFEKTNFPGSFTHSVKSAQQEIATVKVAQNIQTFADQLVLQHFAPASVLINQEGDILYITGRTGKYLEPAAGKANMNIFVMAREGLRNELLSGIRKAHQNYEQIHLRNIKVRTEGGTILADVTIQPTATPEEFKGTILIVFTEVTALKKSINTKVKTGRQTPGTVEKELRIEIQHNQEELQSMREEMQTSQEELKSTNEELQSTNEELQSTNEELTTSKEEMQSLNEELQTVNLELQSKIADFIQSDSDMKNLLNSTEIATLFLDRELNIRRYTDQLKKIIKLRPTDIGRPFTEMVSDLQYDEIADDAREVLRTLVFKESDISGSGNKWFRVRIMPYRTPDERIDGLVITFIDISVEKKLEAELKDKIRILQEHNLYKQ
jgi:two-component system, chemotaxis family, CheB/CheR fusion protein